jgi:hypothetical protein
VFHQPIDASPFPLLTSWIDQDIIPYGFPVAQVSITTVELWNHTLGQEDKQSARHEGNG